MYTCIYIACVYYIYIINYNIHIYIDIYILCALSYPSSAQSAQHLRLYFTTPC